MQKFSLNGQWNCLPDLDDEGLESKWYLQENFKNLTSSLYSLEIPKSFNLIEGYNLFEGAFWHFYEFKSDSEVDFTNYDYQLRFNGANYNTKVWLNGTYVGEHNGGFTPFKFLVNNYLRTQNNFLAVRVDNIRRKDGIPALFFDWFNWGGIYRDVDLLILNKSRVKDLRICTQLITKQKAKIEITFKIIGKLGFKWQLIDLKEQSIVQSGDFNQEYSKGDLTIIIENPKLWSPDTPQLYQIQLFKGSSKEDSELLYQSKFGIRQIEVLNGLIYLNKERIKLKGVSLHEEYMPYGRTIPYDKRKEDLDRIKALGLNAVRTAHYPHDESLMEIADQVGILILEEIPVYWDCNYKSRETFKLAMSMLKDLIKRDFNHPSVIWWSVGNEIPTQKRECSRFIKNLMIFARRYDPTRIVTYVSRKLTSDLCRKTADIATLNTYFGWYFGSVKMLSLVLDWVRTPVFNKPWIFTEFGAGAKYGFRSKYHQKFSEEYQLNLIDYTIRTINSKDYFSGWFIWIFRDFKSVQRSNVYQQGFNRKGIVSEKSTDEKLIFNHLPNILEKGRKILNTKYLGYILWIIFFPFSHYILTHIINLVLKLAEEIPYKLGLRRLSQNR